MNRPAVARFGKPMRLHAVRFAIGVSRDLSPGPEARNPSRVGVGVFGGYLLSITAQTYNPSVNSRMACSRLTLQTRYLHARKADFDGNWGDSGGTLRDIGSRSRQTGPLPIPQAHVRCCESSRGVDSCIIREVRLNAHSNLASIKALWALHLIGGRGSGLSWLAFRLYCSWMR
jgi:hypothetical protein